MAWRRRTDSRVTERMKARTRAARPAYWAPMTDASPGRVSATGRVLGEVPPGTEPAPGFTVGNRDEAFPPGVRPRPGVGTDPLPPR